MPWWQPIAPAEAEVACAGARHVVAWIEGGLRLLDHDDLEAERALRALGGEPPACLALRAAWDRSVADPALVTLGRRPSEAAIGFERPASSTRPGRRSDLLLLFSLPPPMIDRLVLGAIAAAAARWGERGFRSDHGLRMGAALAARATPALRRFGGDLAGPEDSLIVHCTPAGSAVPPTVLAERTEVGIEVTASLPLRWLASVWGAGLSEPGGRLVLEVGEATDEREFPVQLAEWQPLGVGHWEARPRPGSVRRDVDGAWRLVAPGGSAVGARPA